MRTCAQWAAALEDGIGASNNVQIAIESWFIRWSAILPNALLARRGDGLLVDISGRLAKRPCTVAEMDARRAEWQANFGLPQGAEIVMRGTCGCGPIDVKERTHVLHVRLRAEGGYLSGGYRCDVNPAEIRIAGALWSPTFGMLHEFGIDRAWTGEIGFEWHVEEGELVIDGRRTGAAQMESDEWSARGMVPARPAAR